MALLIDGARALAQQGRRSEAADAMAAHGGIGDRLLDGRQLKIMALVEQGLLDEAAEVIDSTVPAEPWEATVASLLRIATRPGIKPSPEDELERVVGEALSLLAAEDPTTAAFRVRLALTTLDVAAGHTPSGSTRLAEAVIDVASTDAYAARDVLGHPAMRSLMTSRQHQNLTAVIAAASLGTGSIPDVHWTAITKGMDHAEARLRALLAAAPHSRLAPSEKT
ncbi:hypothetical protein HII36_22270 [Nonomuraea sp. NN258]|uniref:hypothetical protein n=1 Tax=Nonomuraea antri TaxID=2730852 RepID=UPI00156A15E7|nr:hypothetical protein [Nonomuraea antri]NRQ34545.1 hypothetical protein [Nonomuraea antri]